MANTPRLDTTLYHKTKNSRGYMHPISMMGEKFIEFAKHASPVLDMGCAYGSIVIKAIAAGADRVIACDMEQQHLDILQKQLTKSEAEHLTMLQGKFPDGFLIEDNTIAGIYVSHVLEYLNDKEVDKGLANFFKWLKPGGKLFIKCYTVYIREFVNDKFQTEYQARLGLGVKWPGYFENIKSYSYLPNDVECEYVESAFPQSLHMYDLQILADALKEIGFEIEYAEYLDGRENFASKETWHDGREYIGIIAVKK